MNNQQIFDAVTAHLRKQGRAARDRNTGCKYRWTEGTATLMCAAGCLIKDDVYDPRLEGLAADNPVVLDAIAESLGTESLKGSTTAYLIGGLQTAHDNYLTVDMAAWEGRMAELAHKYSLIYTPPEPA